MNTVKKSKMSGAEIALVLVAGIASYLDAAIIVSTGVALPLWTMHYNMEPIVSGSVNTVLTIAIALGAMSGGWLSDRFGRVRVFNIDILFVTIGTLTVGFAPNMTILFIGLFISGFASGADLPTSLAVISERMSKEHYGRALSSTQLFWTMGIILSQFIGFLTSKMGMMSARYLFIWIGAVAFINWLVRVSSKKFQQIETGLVVTNPDTDEVEEEVEKVSLRDMLKQRRYLMSLIVLTTFYLFWNLPANTFGMFVNYFVVIIDHQSTAIATAIALIGNILAFIVGMIYLRISDTKARYPLMFVGVIGAFVALLIAGALSNLWLVFAACYVLYQLGCVLCGEPQYKIWTQLFYPVNARASFTGLSLGIVRAITAAFALITPVIMNYSAKLLFYILVVFVAIYGICLTQVMRLLRKYEVNDPTLPEKKGKKAAVKNSDEA
ncbi:MFS transporter [Agrilactobacillus yilanensis]|uniref:MFS transporter n=1 Tax=Agrilactobacillus yilanensis TaxID=2485997 RepID=A0ABW4J8X4_9LACO|nr:MFS transporter [Agrilactobacillus yilanensis]